jgi:hypothetical protein
MRRMSRLAGWSRAALILGLTISPAVPVLAQSPSTSTTTTVFIPPTTTLDPGIDVTGGGRFRGGFQFGAYDLFLFTLDAAAVLVADTSDGKGGCNSDTVMDLEQGGVVLASDDDSGAGQCSKILFRLEPGQYELVVRGYESQAVEHYYLTVEFVETECGNNALELLEECDDGNVDGGDCCSAACTKSADGTPCDNGRNCDGADSCSAGECSVHALTPCPGADGDSDCSESCSDSASGCTFPDQPASTCDDGLFCNGADRCHQGACSLHAGDPCPGADADGDCSETCNELSNACDGFDSNGTSCDDTLFCNSQDQCLNGACSVHAGNPCPGPDGDADCRESCRESEDACTARDPSGSACDDGLFCTGADSCASGQCNVHAGNDCPGPDGDSNCAESCNETTHLCTAPDPDTSVCDDSLFCNGADTCSAGICSVHGGSPCPGADGDGNCEESCNETSDDCTAPDSNGSPCNDGVFCNGADTCLGGACSVHAGNPCPGPDGDSNCSESCNEIADTCTAADPNAAVCSDGLFCNGADSCAAGVCSTHAGNPCPGPDGDGNCAESCSESTDACTASDPNGSACSDSLFCNGTDKCQSGACTGHTGDPCPGPDGDGNCAESCDEPNDSCTASDSNGSACSDGVFCNGADTCSAGQCTIHSGNPCPGPDGDGNCAESCNESSDTCTLADTNGSACTDSLFCNGADTCQAGACILHTGNPCPGVDGDGNCAESCSEAADACTAADANGSPCTDGLFCNGADTCSSGACSAHSGSPCAGADGDGNCAESCDEAGDACTAADPNGSACSDGLFCNGADTCQSGACTTHAGTPCPGADGDGNCSESCNEAGDACTAADTNGSTCNDGLFCNGADSCQSGACTAHAGDPCSGADGDGNCSESCSESNDSCTAADMNGSACSDGQFCNGADTCQAGTCSAHAGDPCPGADADGNCAESCSEANDACSAADANGSPCVDGLFCNGADTCQSGACSTHAGNPCPGADGDVDCSETCNESADHCDGADANGTACNDGLECNGTDSCLAGGCVQHTGNPCQGADGDGDCSESCSDAAPGCKGNDPNGTPCDDGVFCNGADRCSNGACSVHLGNPCPGPDGDANCAESCNETTDACTSADPGGSACSDGLFCNGADTCASGACTGHAGNPCPGADGDGNCAESCSEAADACTAADTNGTSCTDGLFCNGPDTCQSGECSAHAGNPCPGADGDDDCAESCSEGADLCNAPDTNGSTCEDGLFCNGADACSSGSCTLHSGNPCPGPDGDSACSESCDEAAQACMAPDTNGSPCDDGLFCNGADSCDAGTCTAHAGDPCPGADADGDCAESCSESSDACTSPDPDGSACDDGVFCDGADSCSDGACSQHAGDPCDSGDGDGDCSEACDEAAAGCAANDPEGAACDDGTRCTTGDECDGAGACAGGAAVACDDSDECTTDGCSETGALCDFIPVPNCPPSTTTTTTLLDFVCGDASGDGAVKAADALAVLQSAVGGTKCDARPCVCDVNANGLLAAGDALLVLRAAVGVPVTLACSC